jgi:hypothetical protein
MYLCKIVCNGTRLLSLIPVHCSTLNIEQGGNHHVVMSLHLGGSSAVTPSAALISASGGWFVSIVFLFTGIISG